jgi:adenylate cyclase
VRALSETQGTTPADQLTLTRVIGQAMERVADAQLSIAGARFSWLDSESVWTDTAVAALVQRVEGLAPSLEQFLGYVWRRHLLAAVLRIAATPSTADRTLTVGFADLVGFTAFSQALDQRELAAMVERFEAVAYAHIPERGGRVVKMIGDEVMFSVEDEAIAAEIALSLVEAHQRDAELPDVRIGLASGPTLAWEGDLYGPTVNLASRLVNLARPRTVLVSDDLGQHLHERDGFALHHLRPVNLQGIGRVRAWVLRRAAT